MIIEKTVARKSLAMTLTLALFASAPMSARSQAQSAAARAVPASGVGVLGSIGAFSLNAVSVTASGTLPNLSLSAPVAAMPLAVEAPPVVGVINALQVKGLVLPETMSTRQDAAPLSVAVQAMPEGSVKQDMIAMAAAINASNNTASSARLGQIFDAAQARAEEAAPVQAGGVSRPLPAPRATPTAAKENIKSKLIQRRTSPGAAVNEETLKLADFSGEIKIEDEAGDGVKKVYRELSKEDSAIIAAKLKAALNERVVSRIYATEDKSAYILITQNYNVKYDPSFHVVIYDKSLFPEGPYMGAFEIKGVASNEITTASDAGKIFVRKSAGTFFPSRNASN